MFRLGLMCLLACSFCAAGEASAADGPKKTSDSGFCPYR
jgi:hypothetical protein